MCRKIVKRDLSSGDGTETLNWIFGLLGECNWNTADPMRYTHRVFAALEHVRLNNMNSLDYVKDKLISVFDIVSYEDLSAFANLEYPLYGKDSGFMMVIKDIADGNVEVALIKVQLPEVKRESFILNGLKKAQEAKEFKEAENTQLADNDFFKAIVNQYQLEVEAGINLIKEYYAMKPFILSKFEKDEKTGETVQTGGCIFSLSIGNKELSVNEYIKSVRRKYWTALFENKKFIGQLTNNLQRDFYSKVEELSGYDFSLYNIYQLKIDMLGKVAKGIEDTIIELFDEFSHKHYYYDETSKNIHYYNGWKTNKSWIVNKKLIIPLNGYRDIGFSWG